MTFNIYFDSGLFSNSQEAVTLAKQKQIGEYNAGKVKYSNYEANYLFEQKKAALIVKDKALSKEKAKSLFAKKQKDFHRNYLVYKDLRAKGYIPKSGIKFGAEFRVYTKGLPHAKWLVFITAPKERLDWKELISVTRISHSTAKKLLIAIIDSEEDISYYELDWLKP